MTNFRQVYPIMDGFPLNSIDLTKDGNAARLSPKRSRDNSEAEGPFKQTRLAPENSLLLGRPSLAYTARINTTLPSSPVPSMPPAPFISATFVMEEVPMEVDLDLGHYMSFREVVDQAGRSMDNVEPSDVRSLTDELAYELPRTPVRRSIPLPFEDPNDYWYLFNAFDSPPSPPKSPAPSMRGDRQYTGMPSPEPEQ